MGEMRVLNVRIETPDEETVASYTIGIDDDVEAVVISKDYGVIVVKDLLNTGVDTVVISKDYGVIVVRDLASVGVLEYIVESLRATYEELQSQATKK